MVTPRLMAAKRIRARHAHDLNNNVTKNIIVMRQVEPTPHVSHVWTFIMYYSTQNYQINRYILKCIRLHSSHFGEMLDFSYCDLNLIF